MYIKLIKNVHFIHKLILTVLVTHNNKNPNAPNSGNHPKFTFLYLPPVIGKLIVIGKYQPPAKNNKIEESRETSIKVSFN